MCDEDATHKSDLEGLNAAIRTSVWLFYAMLLVCLYTVVYVLKTRDGYLPTNPAAMSVPIIGTPMRIQSFCWVAPPVLLGIYLYMHLYLLQVWRRVMAGQRKFPELKHLNRHVHPWPATAFVRSHVEGFGHHSCLDSRFQAILFPVLLWWTTPLTLVLLWGRCLVARDWRLSAWHLVCAALSAVVWYCSYLESVSTLRKSCASGVDCLPRRLRRIAWCTAGAASLAAVAATFLGVTACSRGSLCLGAWILVAGLVAFLFLLGAHLYQLAASTPNGTPRERCRWCGPTTWVVLFAVPGLLAALKLYMHRDTVLVVDLTHQSVSRQPAVWSSFDPGGSTMCWGPS